MCYLGSPVPSTSEIQMHVIRKLSDGPHRRNSADRTGVELGRNRPWRRLAKLPQESSVLSEDLFTMAKKTADQVVGPFLGDQWAVVLKERTSILSRSKTGIEAEHHPRRVSRAYHMVVFGRSRRFLVEFSSIDAGRLV